MPPMNESCHLRMSHATRSEGARSVVCHTLQIEATVRMHVQKQHSQEMLGIPSNGTETTQGLFMLGNTTQHKNVGSLFIYI